MRSVSASEQRNMAVELHSASIKTALDAVPVDGIQLVLLWMEYESKIYYNELLPMQHECRRTALVPQTRLLGNSDATQVRPTERLPGQQICTVLKTKAAQCSSTTQLILVQNRADSFRFVLHISKFENDYARGRSAPSGIPSSVLKTQAK